MKRLLKIFSLVTLGSLIAASGIILNNENEVDVAFGYDTSTLPNTIDLNPVSEANIRGYYSDVSGLRGNNLLIKLKEVLQKDQKYYSYDRGDAIWKIYEIADRDWAKSPASSITAGTYHPDTKIITNYKYGQDNPVMKLLYQDPSSKVQVKLYDNHTQDYGGINREHIWPKSHGFDTGTDGGARGDPMHLRAADGYTNNIHSNYTYGYVDTSKSYVNTSDKFDYNGNNYRGISLTAGSGTVFEPQDSDKGDIARALFYMAARYNNLSGKDNNIDGNNPYLILNNEVNKEAGTSTATEPFSLGIVSDLLEWNKLDPVDDFEKQRNDLLYVNFTNNRNPFIDFPEWADIIWGTNMDTADPTNDALNGGPKQAISLNFNDSDVILKPGESYDLNVTASNGGLYNLTWTNSNSSALALAKASTFTGADNEISGVADGVSFVKVSAIINEQEITATCKVTVRSETKSDVESIFISNTDYQDVSIDGVGGSGTIGKTINKFKDLNIAYYGVNTKKSGGEPYSYGYGMYVQNHGYIYNTTTPAGFYPSKLSVKVNSGTSVDARFGGVFGKKVLNSINSNVSSSKSISTTYELENTDPTNLYWNFSTWMKNVQVKSITITYTRIQPELELDVPAIIGSVGEEITVNSITNYFTDKDLNYKWEIDDINVAKVTPNGTSAKVKILSDGEAYLTCQVSGENQSAEVTIPITIKDVVVKKLVAIQLNTKGRNINFTQGDSFRKSSVLAYYTDGSNSIVTQSCTYQTPDMNSIGNFIVNVSYTEDGVTKTTSYQVHISRAPLYGISMETPKTEYVAGDNYVAPKVYARYKNNQYDSGDVEITSQCEFIYNLDVEGTQTVYIEYTDGAISRELSYQINVVEPEFSGISLENKITHFKVGDRFVTPRVLAHHKNNDYDKTVNVSHLVVVEGFNSSVAGKCKVTISYTEDGITDSKEMTVYIDEAEVGVGCFGSIETTSLILTSISLIGVALILIKKKHKSCK